MFCFGYFLFKSSLRNQIKPIKTSKALLLLNMLVLVIGGSFDGCIIEWYHDHQWYQVVTVDALRCKWTPPQSPHSAASRLGHSAQRIFIEHGMLLYFLQVIVTFILCFIYLILNITCTLRITHTTAITKV